MIGLHVAEYENNDGSLAKQIQERTAERGHEGHIAINVL
jgi:hypothetical protein